MRKPKLGSYTAKDAVQKFVEMLQEDIREISYILMKKKIFGEEERVCYNRANKCWICCEGGFASKNPKVRDHCHFTGRFRGAARNLFNPSIGDLNLHPYCFIISVDMTAI